MLLSGQHPQRPQVKFICKEEAAVFLESSDVKCILLSDAGCHGDVAGLMMLRITDADNGFAEMGGILSQLTNFSLVDYVEHKYQLCQNLEYIIETFCFLV